MLRGLEGRRIALTATHDDAVSQQRTEVVRRVLGQAGAQVDILVPGQASGEEWHGGRYAALVAIGSEGGRGSHHPQLEQLLREFLVSEKPVAATGDALDVTVRAGGAGGRTLAAHAALRPAVKAAGGKSVDEPIHVDGCLISATSAADIEVLAAQIVREFATHLDERNVDEMSEQSFPASDPPSTTPGSIGPAPDRDSAAP